MLARQLSCHAYRERKMPHYATTDFCAEHYFPETRPSGVGAFEVAPLVHSAGVDTLLQRDLTAAIIVLADKGDENKEVLGETGTIQEMLVLSESPDLEVRLNAVHSLSKLLTIDNNRSAPHANQNSNPTHCRCGMPDANALQTNSPGLHEKTHSQLH